MRCFPSPVLDKSDTVRGPKKVSEIGQRPRDLQAAEGLTGGNVIELSLRGRLIHLPRAHTSWTFIAYASGRGKNWVNSPQVTHAPDELPRGLSTYCLGVRQKIAEASGSSVNSEAAK